MTDYERIYAIVRRIPKGRVATYGQVARLAGLHGHARRVGYALSSLPEDHKIPWQRVINAKGEISPRSQPHAEDAQQTLLRREGIVFDKNSRISFSRFLWRKEL